MTRRFIGAWADTLPEDERPAAIVGLGVLLAEIIPGAGLDEARVQAREIAAGGPVRIADHLFEIWAGTQRPNVFPKRLRWGHRERERWEAFKALFSPEMVAGEWARFTAQLDRVELQTSGTYDLRDRGDRETMRWLNAQSWQPGARVDGLYFHDADWRGDRRDAWHWPLRIGLLGDPQSQAVFEEYNADNTRDWVRNLTTPIEVERNGLNCDLLLSPLGFGATAKVLRRARVKASAIVFFEQPFRSARGRRLSEAPGELAAASAVAFVPGQLRYEFLVELIRHISHDQCLDTALRQACRDFDGPPLVLSRYGFVDNTRISLIAERWAGNLERRGDAEGAALLRSQAAAPYLSEMGTASQFLRIAQDTNARRPGARYVDAAVWPHDAEAYWRREIRSEASSLARGEWNIVGAWITPKPPKAQAVDAPVAFPDGELAWDGGYKELTAVIAAPGCDVVAIEADAEVDERRRVVIRDSSFSALSIAGYSLEVSSFEDSVVARLRAYAAGDSGPALFLVRPRASLDRFKARLIIMHENRILQTGILEGAIEEAPRGGARRDWLEEDDRPTTISFKVEGVLRPNLQDLDDRRSFDLALLTNDSLTGAAQFTAVADARVWLRDFGDLKAISARIADRLRDLIDEPETFEDPASEALTSLLKQLAHEGVLIRDALRDAGLGPVLDRDPERIQIVSANPDEFLPLEFIYDGPAPDPRKAAACPNQPDALVRGHCGTCPNRQSRHHVCPTRFWGLRKVIERHLYDGKCETPGSQILTNAPASDRRIGPPLVRLFASSDRANKHPNGDRAIAGLQGAMGQDKVVCAADWDGWRDCIAEKAPALLVLLPHTGRDEYGEYLEIGTDEKLTNAQIGRDIVGESPPVIVLLLGCETARADVPYASFIGRFRHAEASVVIGTLTPILGRHAAPVAEALVARLEGLWKEPHRAVTIGDAMTAMRRDLLRASLPAGLAVVAFGDADWLLGE